MSAGHVECFLTSSLFGVLYKCIQDEDLVKFNPHVKSDKSESMTYLPTHQIMIVFLIRGHLIVVLFVETFFIKATDDQC